MSDSTKVYTADQDDERLDRFLTRMEPTLSRAHVQKVIAEGQALVSGRVRKANYKLQAGEEVTFHLPEAKPVEILPEDIPLDILYEDEIFLVVNKPAGMIVHPTHRAARNTLVHAVAGYFERRGEAAGIHPLYRLDRDTTGIVILAKSARIQHVMTQHHGQIYREYLALVQGHLDRPSGRIDMPIARDITRANHWQVRADGRRALTEYENIASWPSYSLLKIHLLTGRTHQIRVHFAALGHPLLGDTAYDGSCDTIPRQALHAWRVHFFHPDTGKEIRIEAPIPEDMCRLIGSDTVSRETFKEEIK